MKKEAAMKRSLVILVAIAGLMVTAAPAEATSLQPVVIKNAIVIGPPPDFHASGPFTATGPLCPSGQSVDIFRRELNSTANSLDLVVAYRFTCDDGSGTFDIALAAHLTFAPFTDHFVWAVIGGTGAYTHLHGFGTGTSVPVDGDVYTGHVLTN